MQEVDAAWQQFPIAQGEIASQAQQIALRLSVANNAQKASHHVHLKYHPGAMTAFEFLRQAQILQDFKQRVGWKIPADSPLVGALRPGYHVLSEVDEWLRVQNPHFNHRFSPQTKKEFPRLAKQWDYPTIKTLCEAREEQIKRAFAQISTQS